MILFLHQSPLFHWQKYWRQEEGCGLDPWVLFPLMKWRQANDRSNCAALGVWISIICWLELLVGFALRNGFGVTFDMRLRLSWGVLGSSYTLSQALWEQAAYFSLCNIVFIHLHVNCWFLGFLDLWPKNHKSRQGQRQLVVLGLLSKTQVCKLLFHSHVNYS